MLAVIGAAGQGEREAMLERQGESIAKAKGRDSIGAVCRPLGGDHQAQVGNSEIRASPTMTSGIPCKPTQARSTLYGSPKH